MSQDLSFTKEEYATLLRLAYLGNWLATSVRTDIEENKYDQMLYKLLAYAEQYDLDSWVDAEDGVAFPSVELESDEEINTLQDHYDEETFWPELSMRLGDLDIGRQYSEEEWQRFSDEERFVLRMRAAGRFEDEFSEYGLDRLCIKAEA